MRGSVAFQVQYIYTYVNEIGSSKHEAKAKARNDGATTWHQVGKYLGVFSHSTADAYRDVWRQALNYSKLSYHINDIEKLSGDLLKAFLIDKINDGIAHATHAQYSAALEKLEVALNRYAKSNKTGVTYNFKLGINDARMLAKNLEKFEGSRAYEKPDQLVNTVEKNNFKLAASLQRESGARISEINHICTDQLRGFKIDIYTGDNKGWIFVKGKGGKEREVGVSLDTYSLLQTIANRGRFEFDKDAYRKALSKAAQVTDQEYQGSHGLRWSWAQDRHKVLQKSGLTYEQTLTRISQEMGHERADITEHYLR